MEQKKVRKVVLVLVNLIDLICQNQKQKLAGNGRKELEALYKALSQQFDIGDYDTFKSKMRTPDDRKTSIMQ